MTSLCKLDDILALAFYISTVVGIDQQASNIGQDVVTQLNFSYINPDPSENQDGWIEMWNLNSSSTEFSGEATLDSGFRVKTYSIK